MARKKDYKSVNGENPELLESLVGNGENTDRPPLQTMGISRNLYNVLVMAFSFLMLFVAFQVIFPHFPLIIFSLSFKTATIQRCQTCRRRRKSVHATTSIFLAALMRSAYPCHTGSTFSPLLSFASFSESFGGEKFAPAC